MRFIDITGQRFGRLTVVRREKGRQWLCRCDCSVQAVFDRGNLNAGRTQSCGCFHREVVTKHGHNAKQSRVYRSWTAMRQRCLNPSYYRFAKWGGRGITICERWNDFLNFLADMGEPPIGMTLDRIDNNGPYSPANCRWATKKQQIANRG